MVASRLSGSPERQRWDGTLGDAWSPGFRRGLLFGRWGDVRWSRDVCREARSGSDGTGRPRGRVTFVEKPGAEAMGRDAHGVE